MVAKRGVLFEFSTALAADADKGISALEKRIDELQKRASNIAVGISQASVQAASAQANAVFQAQRVQQQSRSAKSVNRVVGFAGAANGYGDIDQEQVKKAQAQIEHLQRLADAAQQREDDRQRKKTQDQAAKDAAAARERRRKANDARRDAELADADAATKSASKADSFNQKITDLQAKELRNAERQRQREADRAAREQQEAQAKVTAGLNASLDAAMRLARGFTFLGLAGERDMHKVQDALLKVQGTIDAVRGGIDTFRSVKGGLDALKTLKDAGAVKTAIEVGSKARLGAAGVGAAGAGATAVAAIGTLGLGAIADYRRSGKGLAGLGHVGGFYDRLGSGVVNIGASGAGYGLGAVGAIEGAFNSPYGLTSREREQRSEGFLENFAAKIAPMTYGLSNVAFGNRRAERQQRFFEEERANRNRMLDLREQIDSAIVPLQAREREFGFGAAAQRYGIRTEGIQRRGSLIEQRLAGAFGRQQTAFGEQLGFGQQAALGGFVDQTALARAVAERAREEGNVTKYNKQREDNLRNQLQAAASRGREIGSDLTAARQRKEAAGNDEFARKSAFAEELSHNEKLQQNLREQAELKNRIRQIGVEGAQRELALNEQRLAVAKSTADSLRQQGQSAAERFGGMLPGERRAVLEAARAAKAADQKGQILPRYHLQQLESMPGFEDFVRRQKTTIAKKEGFDELADLSGLTRRTKAAEGEERQLGKLVVDNRTTINGQLDLTSETLQKEVVNIFVPLVQQALESMKEEVRKEIERAGYDLQRQQNEQGRQGAGG